MANHSLVAKEAPTQSFKRPTLVDIARECGLSRATVGRAISGKGYVDPERRRQIQETANRLGYRASTIARALRTQRTSSIGVMIADITNPIFPQIVKGIDEVVSTAGHTIFLCNTDEDANKQKSIVRSLLDRHVDGIIFVSQNLTPDFLDLIQNAPPCVYVNRQPAEGTLDYVGPNNAQSIELLLDHLCGLGHERIAYIAGPLLSSTAQERLENFRHGMATRGLPVNKNMLASGNYNIESGINAARKFLRLKTRPTAIIAANDFTAIGVITHCQQAGLRVPEDISVTGFDDAFDMQVTSLYPLLAQGITTISQPKRELGRTAGRLLLTRIANPAGPQNTVILPTELKIRNTTTTPRVTLGS